MISKSIRSFVLLNIWICALSTFIPHAKSQITDFSAAHVSGSQDVEIKFQLGSNTNFTPTSIPSFSISIDGGKSYLDTIKTFDAKASPANGIRQGLNRFIWKAATDYPNTYVDPAFVRMSLNVSRDLTPTFQFQTGAKPAIKINKSAPAFEVVKYIAGMTLTDYASSLDTLVPPGVYAGSDLKDLISKIDPNAWLPGTDQDQEPEAFSTPPTVQDGTPSPASDREGLKFGGPIISYSDKPDVTPGKPTLISDNPRTTKGVADSNDQQVPIPETITGNSIIVRFNLFRDEIRLAESQRLNNQTGPNFKAINRVYNPDLTAQSTPRLPIQDPALLPREPGISLASERGLIWSPGDYVIGITGTGGLIDIALIKDPHWEHSSPADEHHDLIYKLQASLGAQFDLPPGFSQIKVWRAVFSNANSPLESIGQFSSHLKEHLVEVLSVTEPELKKVQTTVTRGIAKSSSGGTATTLENIWNSGPITKKYNVVITGDGFANNAADNQIIRDWINNQLLTGFTTADIQPAYLNAVNFFFMDAKSVDSGITQTSVTTINPDELSSYTGQANYVDSVVSASDPEKLDVYRISGTRRNTAWGFAAAGWDRCWRIPLNGWTPVINAATSALGRKPDEVWVIANTPSGGCRSSDGGVQCVYGAVSASATTILHEWGHSFGGLADEYTKPNGYPPPNRSRLSGSEINVAEVDSWDGTYSGIKSNWKNWIPSWRPLPTVATNVALEALDVGLFLGGYYSTNGVFRPALKSRMNSNTPEHSPVGATAIRNKAANYREQDLRRNSVLDANNDGKFDIVIQDDRQLALFLSADRTVGVPDPVRGSAPRSVTGVLEPTWFTTGALRTGSRAWEFRSSDNLAVCDFNGDGKQDLFIHNTDAWGMPYIGLLRSTGTAFEVVKRYDGALDGWEMKSGDIVKSADFDGDGTADWLTVFNGSNWSFPYLGVYRVDSNHRLQFVERFDRFLPAFEMGKNERFEFVDINGDGADDIVSINQADWSKVHIQVYVSLRNGQFALSDRFYGQISNGIDWNINRRDQYFFGDWNGDGVKDLAIFNGKTWDTEYFGLFIFNRQGKSSGFKLSSDRIPGWNLQPNDVIKPFDRDGNGVSDFVIFNAQDWGNTREYLGIIGNDGKGNFSARWQKDWIGGWNLGSVDEFKVTNFRGSDNWDDLFIFNREWFGLFRGNKSRFSLETIYYRWIDNQRYHANGLY